ncbi:MAG: porin [Pseudomonadota bacterium]
MRRSTLALFLLSPLAVLAQTPSSINVYGVVDAGVVAESGCATNCSTRISSGIASESRLGLQGREALGDKLAAVFTVEAGFQTDTGMSDEGRLFGRQAYVGLDSRWGALTLGRQYNLQYETLIDVADPFRGGLAGSATNLAGYTVRRYDNSVKYATPKLRGWSASAIYSYGESPYSSKYNRAYGATIGYENGPFNVRIAHQRKRDMLAVYGTVPGADFSARNTLVAANLNFRSATIYAAYGINRGLGSTPWDISNPYGALVPPSPSTDSRDVITGISIPMGAATWMVSYIHKDDRTLANQDANQVAAGVTYSLSKRTSVYGAIAKIHNRNGAGYTVGNASNGGRGNGAINIGLRHSF